ncbi:MAG: hypothetical protein IPG50_00295 [Myxococcales bacterium]|nr:hypothetical protein [Myxococcales bacterium]
MNRPPSSILLRPGHAAVASLLALLAAPNLAFAQAAPTDGTKSTDDKTSDKAGDKAGDKPTDTKGDGAAASGGIGVAASAGTDAKGDAKVDADKKPEDLALGSAGARAAGTAPPGTNYGNFMDTRLTWTLGEDDFLHRTGEITPISQNLNIGDRPQYRLPADGLNSRFAGRENLTHLVMYKKMPAFVEGLTTEAALVLRFDLASLSANTGSLNSALYDSGSYIRLFYGTSATNKKLGLSTVLFPLDTDRFRLGYLYDISWGGTAANINQSIFPRIQGSSPGAKVQYDGEGYYVFAGFKTATIVQPQQVLSPGGESEVETVRVGETNYGGLLGGGVDLGPVVRVDLGAGAFQQGKFDLEDVRGKSVYTYGGSARVVVHHNMPVPSSVDFQLYRNDPNAPQILFAPEKYNADEFAVAVSGETSVLNQHLKDFDRSGTTKDQSAVAGALQSVFKVGYARLSVTGLYKQLNFIVRNVPGFIPFETLPANAKSDPELFGALAADYHIASLKLTPGISGGIQLPATFRSEFADGGSVPASRTIIVRTQGDNSILPYGAERSVAVQGRLSLRWTMSDMLGAVLWTQVINDNNGTLVVRDPVEGTASLRKFQDPLRIGAGLSLQARF